MVYRGQCEAICRRFCEQGSMRAGNSHAGWRYSQVGSLNGGPAQPPCTCMCNASTADVRAVWPLT